MKALVLSGGAGARLRPITHTSAAQLLPVATGTHRTPRRPSARRDFTARRTGTVARCPGGRACGKPPKRHGARGRA